MRTARGFLFLGDAKCLTPQVQPLKSPTVNLRLTFRRNSIDYKSRGMSTADEQRALHYLGQLNYYRLGLKYGSHAHLNAAIFQNPAKHSQSVDRLKEDVDQSREEFIRHLNAKYSEALPPIWAVVELMSLGQLSSWYGNLKHRADLKSVADDFNMGGEKLKSYLHHLTVLRNFCAHHARVWNRQIGFTINLPTGPIGLVNSLNRDPVAQRKLYNTYVILVFLLNQISPGHHWKIKLFKLIDEHSIDTERMGFPNDWRKLPIWR